MAKKKRVPSSARDVNLPMFIELRRAELTEAINNDHDNLYAGPEHPHPNHGGYGTIKHINIVWYKDALDGILQGASPLLQPCTPGTKRRLLKLFIRNDGYAHDPAYGQHVSSETQVKFWKRDTRGESERGLDPPPHPDGDLPGVHY